MAPRVLPLTSGVVMSPISVAMNPGMTRLRWNVLTEELIVIIHDLEDVDEKSIQWTSRYWEGHSRCASSCFDDTTVFAIQRSDVQRY